MRLLPLLVLFSLAAIQPGVAHNNYFLPGDSFFSTALSEVAMEKWMTSKETAWEFSYQRFDGRFYSCGSIGYTNLAVEGIEPRLRQALGEAYWRYRSGTRPMYRDEGMDGKSDLQQCNNVVALIYDKRFGADSTLGLKYNEDWMNQGGGIYGGFYERAPAVVRDWQDGKSHAPLAVQEKLDPLAHLHVSYEVARVVDKPLHIGSGEIQIILVGFADPLRSSEMQTCANLQDIFDGKPDARYMVVTTGVVRDFTCDVSGVWKEEVIPIPVVEGSQVPKELLVPMK